MEKMKRLFSAIMAGVMVCILVFGAGNMEAKASDADEYADESLLTDEDHSEATVGSLTRGTYLKSGTSSISQVGSGKISAGGETVAQKVGTDVSVYVRVQKKVANMWTYYKTWSASKTDAAYVGTSKTLTVDKGYYYRVYCTHVAGSDSSGSYTNGIYID